MNRSLENRLSLMLGVTIVLVGLAAALASFTFAYYEAQEFQDDTLRGIAESTVLRGRVAKSAARDGDDPERALMNDGSLRLTILHLPYDPAPSWLQADLSAGFHTEAAQTTPLRVFVRDLAPGERLVVAQPTDMRDELALGSALRTLVPLLLMLPVLVLLTVHIVRAELEPVRQLAENLDRQSPDSPQSLGAADVPAEIGSFVAAINRLLARVNRLIEQQRRFIADAAHELRSPLTALSVQAQNLERADSPQAMRERILPLMAGIERVRRLSEQLLSLARTQAAGEDKNVDVSRVVREMIAEFLAAAEQRGIDLGLEETAPLCVMAPPDTLRLVLKNALDNALSYTPRHGQVTVRLAPQGEEAVIEIVDTGPGIPALERERVFEPFYRIEGSPGQGSGLGLAIARDAAKRLGGRVTLRDRPGGTGLVFEYRQRRALTP
jgi:two-component system OmpR family sensor kinase